MPGLVRRSGVTHEAGVDIFVCPSLDQVDLTTAVFFCRRANESHTARQIAVGEDFCGAEERSQGRGRNEIVAAGVADVRQSIVLCIVGHDCATITKLSLKGCLQAVGMAGNFVPQVGQGIAEGIVGVVLLVSKFWVSMNLCIGQMEIYGVDAAGPTSPLTFVRVTLKFSRTFVSSTSDSPTAAGLAMEPMVKVW